MHVIFLIKIFNDLFCDLLMLNWFRVQIAVTKPMSVILHKNKRLNRTESHLEKLAKEDTLSKSCGIPFTVGEVD